MLVIIFYKIIVLKWTLENIELTIQKDSLSSLKMDFDKLQFGAFLQNYEY